ncbi:helix-turn-helix domain-containing protein [Lacticigenium naphthae]|uniref:helix-turn-helix domain-containing protein n=1 Tax=Lacticigenium naphthae TaxID=515351 RepID=UPI000403F920|nr:helix-turn-helix transcriptional regulator [Lacticigenium naphthae]
MPETESVMGSTFRKIREDKAYTQKQISDHSMSRSTYTKFELDEINPNVLKYLRILDHMDMSHEEFLYILNGYKWNEKEALFKDYKQVVIAPTLLMVKDIIQRGEEFLKKRYDQLILDVVNICRGYEVLLTTNKTESAKEFAQKVWDRLENIEEWYLSEMYLLAGILYVFPVETAQSLTAQVLKKLTQYADFDEAATLKKIFLFQIGTCLLNEKEYTKALNCFSELTESAKEKTPSLLLGIALIKEAVCLEELQNKKEAAQKKEEAKNLFQLIDQTTIWQEAEQNPKSYWNEYYSS